MTWNEWIEMFILQGRWNGECDWTLFSGAHFTVDLCMQISGQSNVIVPFSNRKVGFLAVFFKQARFGMFRFETSEKVNTAEEMLPIPGIEINSGTVTSSVVVWLIDAVKLMPIVLMLAPL
mmetsp:Transcript_47078/g.53172  ORF Transcript_47078/g.53172 Transcript_47078/m.53172 type:complete len:120 (-) Transcript_47078:1053-1412(-)